MKNRIGIIGGGQLGRMLGVAAKQMGFHVTVTDPTPKSPASHVVDEQIVGGYSDPAATRKLASVSDFVTIEIEHINTETLHELSKNGTKINPHPKTIEMIKDKYAQKLYLKKHKIPTAAFREILTKDDILDAARKWKFPILLKAKHDAFDGRGNMVVKNVKDVERALEIFRGRALYAEQFVPFTRELAVIAARDIKGKLAFYPVVETIHKNNICHIVKAPAPVTPGVKRKTLTLSRKVMRHLKGAGVFAIEMFLTRDGKVLINEIAPRVHNSGHFTIEGSVTSQFQQHIRAITGLPLGDTSMRVPAAVMINILGERKGPVDVKGFHEVFSMTDVHVHIYGKLETKPERKMGHITATGKTMKDAYNKAVKARKLLSL